MPQNVFYNVTGASDEVIEVLLQKGALLVLKQLCMGLMVLQPDMVSFLAPLVDLKKCYGCAREIL